MIKVIVTGAYSTGKSNLVDALAASMRQDGLSIIQIPDASRTCPLPLNQAQTEATSLWLITTQVSREIEASSGPQSVMLCDRGVPDVLAHDEERSLGTKMTWLTHLREFSERWIETYDVILFSHVDKSILIEPDGLRSCDEAYRDRLDQCAAEVVAHRPGVVNLAHDPQRRLRQARDAINASLARPRNSSSR